jgi:2-dehydro-3-deoxyphosphooctonate aldolase (KDO 8-P synthase)
MSNKEVKIGNVTIGNHLPFAVIIGPCQIQSREHTLFLAKELKDITSRLGIGFIFKASYDKANRTSIDGARGIGMEKGLDILDEVRQTLGVPGITDVHETWQCEIAAKKVDILQIPAFLCRQTDLIVAAAKTGLPINIKKGQFLAPWDMRNVVKKAVASGNSDILVTERGTCFGYNNLVSDMRSLVIMGQEGTPVVFDATHSVQLPGGNGTSTGGQREFVAPLARAAVATGIAALFMETHEDPDKSPSDGPNMLPLSAIEETLKDLIQIDRLIKHY